MDDIDVPAGDTGPLDPLDQPTESDADWAIPREYDVAGQTDAERAAHPVEEDSLPPSPAPAPTPLGRRPSSALAISLGSVAALVLAAGLAAWLAVNGSSDPAPSAAHAARTPPASKMPSATGSTTTAVQSGATTPTRIVVPDVQGMDTRTARAALEDAAFRVRVERVHSNRAADTLLRQSPEAGSRVARATQVTLVISEGLALTAVPDVVGTSAENAVRRLRASGLVARMSLVASSRRAGTVLSQDPEPQRHVRPHSAVRLRVAKAVKPARVVVPDLVGLTAAAAKDELRSLGLRWSVDKTTSSRPAGTVVDQSPTGGVSTRATGAVTLTVSSGAPSVSVPDVTGLDEASARQKLTAAGLQAVVSYDDGVDPTQDGIVLDQSPGPDESAPSGSTVLLTVGRSS